MVENQMSDIILQFSDKSTLKSVKFFPSHANGTIAKLYSEAQPDQPYSLPDIIPANGFKLLLRYYGYGIIDIDENNAVDVLFTSLCVGDMYLFDLILTYTTNHISLTICKAFLELLPKFDQHLISNLEEMICSYLVENGFELLNQSIFINII